ncbi:hypothetical protein [Mycolicibacterium confluentis]|uniref:Fibronectin-binding protein n=1 Tax=Mycolicibacterium confluentis TaxID=28047 RepID=A0A7I7XQY2_9MYCO|nr:hypothetical protein [Mycolicibacterium confluentis]MCV7322444.1 fibronectin-binding protein [Mycolicibacterium confluentis]BBZ31493.1 hypothetical protein MCNF_00980 [Mycolicibacterium confluentis]
MLRRAAIATFAAATGTAAAVAFAGTASADPGGPPPCGPLGFVCNMLPMMPELDHDLDLTQNQPPATIDTENSVPADACAMGCV